MNSRPLRVYREFHTWREAVLQAVDAANYFSTNTKPSVRWYGGRWILQYDAYPVPMNSVGR